MTDGLILGLPWLRAHVAPEGLHLGDSGICEADLRVRRLGLWVWL